LTQSTKFVNIIPYYLVWVNFINEVYKLLTPPNEILMSQAKKGKHFVQII